MASVSGEEFLTDVNLTVKIIHFGLIMKKLLSYFQKRNLTHPLVAIIFVAMGSLYLQKAYALSSDVYFWAEKYAGKSTSEFISDKRSISLLKQAIPTVIAADVIDTLGGPPEPIVLDQNRYLFASACAWKNCGKKGFFWFDYALQTGVGGYLENETLHLGSEQIAGAHLPGQAMHSIKNWLQQHRISPTRVSFYSGSGRTISLPTKDFAYSKIYSPKDTGPSFDCNKRLTLIESEICGSAILSQSDIKLAMLVEEIRAGHSTAAARRQLKNLQKNWLRKRNSKCSIEHNIADCLQREYTEQYGLLRNWVPIH